MSGYDGQFNIYELPIYEGYMNKKGGAVNARGGRRNWKKRWFVLAAVNFKGKEIFDLEYYDSPNGNLKGTISLLDVEIYCDTNNDYNRKKNKFEFQILLGNGGVLQLSCDDYDERESWIESLNMTISYLRKIMVSSGFSLNGYDPMFEDEEDCYELGELIGEECQAYGPGLVGAEAGVKTNFMIQSYDINGDIVEEGGLPFTATISNEDYLYFVRVNDNKDGTYSGCYAIGKPGDYLLHIRINDEHNVNGSPFKIKILPTKTKPEYCYATGDCLHEIHPNQPSQFTVVAKDYLDNNKIKGGDPFEVNIIGPAKLDSLVDNSDGTYTCTYTASNISESKTLSNASILISITLYGKHIAGSPFRPIVLAAIDPIIPANAEDPTSNEFKISNPQSDDDNFNSLRSKKSGRLPPKVKEEIITTELASLEKSSSTPMSRLEKARQRAILAKKLSENSITLSPAVAPNNSMQTNELSNNGRSQRRATIQNNDLDPITGLPINQSKTKVLKLSDLDVSTTNTPVKSNEPVNKVIWDMLNGTTPAKQIDTNKTITGRRASVMRSDYDPITGLPYKKKEEESNNNTKSSPNRKTSTMIREEVFAKDNYTKGFSDEELEAIVRDLSDGMVGPMPNNITDEEKLMWELARQALDTNEVLELIINNLLPLKETFNLMSNVYEGIQLLKLTDSTNKCAFRLFEEYDLIPNYITLREAKSTFILLLKVQKNANKPSSIAIGGIGLDFSHFLKLMVMIAVYSLSKTTAFMNLYKTPQMKVDVMLKKWGFADKYKLKVIHDKLFK